MEGTSVLLLFLVLLGFVAGDWYATRGLVSGADPRRSLKMKATQDQLRWSAPREDTDPVCGKIISTDRAKPSLHDRWVYYFCSQECREIFEAAPDRYVANQASAQPHAIAEWAQVMQRNAVRSLTDRDVPPR